MRSSRARARAFSPSRAPGRRPFVDVLGDYERYVSTYFPIEGPDGQGYYLTGDGARRDEDGYTVHLDHRTGRRRHQLVGPPHRHRRGRVGRGATPTHITPSPGSTSSIYDRASVSSLSRFLSLSLSLSLWTLVALPRRMLASLLTLREHARKAGWGALPRPLEHVELSDHGGYTLGPNGRRLHNLSVVTKYIYLLRDLERIVKGSASHDAMTRGPRAAQRRNNCGRRLGARHLCSLGARPMSSLFISF